MPETRFLLLWCISFQVLSLKFPLSRFLLEDRFEYHNEVCIWRIEFFELKKKKAIASLNKARFREWLAAPGKQKSFLWISIAFWDSYQRWGTFNTWEWLFPIRHYKISFNGLTRILKLSVLVYFLRVLLEGNKALMTYSLRTAKGVKSLVENWIQVPNNEGKHSEKWKEWNLLKRAEKRRTLEFECGAKFILLE